MRELSALSKLGNLLITIERTVRIVYCPLADRSKELIMTNAPHPVLILGYICYLKDCLLHLWRRTTGISTSGWVPFAQTKQFVQWTDSNITSTYWNVQASHQGKAHPGQHRIAKAHLNCHGSIISQTQPHNFEGVDACLFLLRILKRKVALAWLMNV